MHRRHLEPTGANRQRSGHGARASQAVQRRKDLAGISRHPLSTDFYYGAIAPLKTKVALTGLKGEVLYLNGIGTTGTVTRFLEGATGTGTSERIRDAYRFLAEHYQDGDRIFGFGFSRGAFAIRSLAGLIDAAGLPARRRALKAEE